MLELIGAITLAIFSVLAVAAGAGNVSEKEKKRKIKESSGHGTPEGLSGYGIKPRIDKQSDSDVEDAEKARMMRIGFGGMFNPSTGDIEKYEDDEHVDEHEGFHKWHFTERNAPTKKMRKKLNEKWSYNKENLLEVKKQMSGLPRNPVRWGVEPFIEDKSESGNYATAIINEASDRKDPLKDIRNMSEEFERENDRIIGSAAYLAAKNRCDLASIQYKDAAHKIIGTFLDSETGYAEIRLKCHDLLDNYDADAPITQELMERAREDLRIDIYRGIRFNEHTDESMFQNFIKFAQEHHNNELKDTQEKKKAYETCSAEMSAELDDVSEKHMKKAYEYVIEKLQDYKRNPSNKLVCNNLDEFGPLTEGFAYYLTLQHLDLSKEGLNSAKKEVKKVLGEKYAKNEDDLRKYIAALDRVFSLHERLKTHGKLDDKDAMKIVLPAAKYVGSVNELTDTTNEKYAVRELAKYAKISQNLRGEITETFGEYRGITALKHFRNMDSDTK